MIASITTTCKALDWVVSKARYTGSEEIHPDLSKSGESVIYNWAFRAMLSDKMVREIRSYITIVKQVQKTYGERIVVDGYEIDCSELARTGRGSMDVSHICISRVE